MEHRFMERGTYIMICYTNTMRACLDSLRDGPFLFGGDTINVLSCLE